MGEKPWCSSCVLPMSQLLQWPISEQLWWTVVPASYQHVRLWILAFLPQGYLWNTNVGAFWDCAGVNTWGQPSTSMQPDGTLEGLLHSFPSCPQIDGVSVAYNGNQLVQQTLTDSVPPVTGWGLPQACQHLLDSRPYLLLGFRERFGAENQRQHHLSSVFNYTELSAKAGWNQ